MNTHEGCIVLFDKKPGMTSFESLYAIKHALGTKKIGHTGTLDSFASGLLVVLAENLTRLAPIVTHLDKTYIACITFGSQTDTLDPLGSVVSQSALPQQGALSGALKKFTGTMMQEPPQYSAIKINGERASDMARQGKSAALKKREITIHNITLDDVVLNGNGVQCATITVSCSSGTYIRALARDISGACNSCAHVSALRRTRVGPFCVEEAGADDVGAAVAFTPDVAEKCGMEPLVLLREHEERFFNGKPLNPLWFCAPQGCGTNDAVSKDTLPYRAVFLTGGAFVGVVHGTELSYGFVVPREKVYA
jgi:tRNA pseudouridine55 synthase